MTDGELFAIRVGCLQVLDKVDVEGEGSADDRRRAKEIAQEIMRLIRESPIVVEDPQGTLAGDSPHWTPATVFGVEPPRRAALQLSGYVSFKVHWPRKNQELFRYSGPCFEDFAITYDGTIYTVSTCCDDLIERPYCFHFGREGHRILTSILAPAHERDENLIRAPGQPWDLQIVGPCPMYTIPYVAFVDDPSTYSTRRELIREGNTLESMAVISRRDCENPDDAMRDILAELRFPASVHYQAMLDGLEFYRQQECLYEQFEKATKLYRETAKAFTRDPRKWPVRITSNRKLRESVGLAYSHYAELEEARADANRGGRSADEVFSKNPLLQPHRGCTAEQLADVFEWNGQHVMEGLRFFAEESRSRGLESATLLGPLIGGVIAIAATVLTLLLT